jgi:tripartite-type tricarboxylate transporter receptor subunit TctC
VKAGNLRILAASSAVRSPAFPDVPTLKEKGIDVEYAVWAGLFATKGVPEAVKAKLEATIAKIVADPGYKAAVESVGVSLAYQDAKTFKAWWDADAAKTEAVIAVINGKSGG